VGEKETKPVDGSGEEPEYGRPGTGLGVADGERWSLCCLRVLDINIFQIGWESDAHFYAHTHYD